MRATFDEIIPRSDNAAESFVFTAPQDAQHLGDISVLVDTAGLPNSLRYLGALISGSFRRAYYATASKNIQQNFTSALRAVNDALAQEAQSGTAQWVGMLQSVVIASDGQSLLVATTGGYLAYLNRGGRVLDIPLEAGEGTRPFGSFTAGALKINDSILIGPRQALDEQNTETALAKDSSRLLKRLHKNGVSCIRIGVAQDALPGAPSIIGRAGDIAYSTRELTRNVWRGIKPMVRKLSGFMALVIKGISAMNPKERISTVLSRFRNFSSQKLKSGKDATQEASSRVAQGAKISSDIVKRFRMPKVPNIPTIKVSKLKSPRIIGTIAVLVLVTGLGTILLLRAQNIETDIYSAEALTAAKAALERGETKIILGDETAAIKAFSEGLTAIEGVNGGDSLRQELTERRNKLAGIISANTTTLLSFTGFPVGLNPENISVVSNGESIAIALGGSTHPAIWLNEELTLIDGTFYVLPQEFVSGVLDISSSESIGAFAVVTAEGMVLIDANDKAELAKASNTDNEASSALVAQSEALVFTISSGGELRAFSYNIAEEASLTEKDWFIHEDKRLTKSRDLISFDKEPYALIGDNTFLRLRRNLNASLYTIEGFNWNGVASAFDAFDDGRLAILDTKNSRILITKANGDIITQYEIDGANNAFDIAIMPRERSILILTPDSVLELHIPELPAETIS